MKNFRIQTILVLALMLSSSMPILGLGMLEAWRWREASTNMAKERVLTKAEALEDEIRRLFEIRLSAFELLAEQIRLRSDGQKIASTQLYPVMELYAQSFNLVSVGLSDMEGRILEYYGINPEARKKLLKLNVREHGFIDLILKHKTSVVAPLKIGKVSQRNAVFLASPVWDLNKQNIIGTVGSAVVPTEIQRIAERVMATSPVLQFRILDQNGVIISESAGANVVGPLRKTKIKLYAAVGGTQSEIRQGTDEHGTEVFAAAQALNLRATKWTVIVSESKEALLQNERESLKQMWFIMASALIISFLLATLISVLISKPMVRLIEAMQMIKEGRYEQVDESLQCSRFGFREVRAAWLALSAMAKRLHDYTVNLETLVAERTRELRDQEARAIESARLASLGEMAGGIAHEINNPLSIISLVAQQQETLLKRGMIDPARSQEAFKTIGGTADRIVKIINGLRKLSRDGSADPIEKADVRSILENTLTYCHEKFKNRSIELTVSYCPPDLSTLCRPVQASQVVLNLLNNAFDAVESAALQGAQEKWIRIEVTDQPPEVEIRVTDSGAGIPEQYREKIFQPFFTLKEVGKGTGLGLSISRSIVESLGGRVELDQTHACTSFVIYLPRAE